MAIPDQEVVYYLRTWYRCDPEQSKWLFMNSGLKKNPKFYFDNISVKVGHILIDTKLQMLSPLYGGR